MRPRHIIALLCLASSIPALATEAQMILVAARSLHPTVAWQARSVVKGDLTCSGRPTIAILGVDGLALKVAVFHQGAKKQPLVLHIASDLEAKQATMSLESQDFEVGTGQPGDPGTLPGFLRSSTCKGLKLDDERIDSVHIYWNRQDRMFQHWQR